MYGKKLFYIARVFKYKKRRYFNENNRSPLSDIEYTFYIDQYIPWNMFTIIFAGVPT